MITLPESLAAICSFSPGRKPVGGKAETHRRNGQNPNPRKCQKTRRLGEGRSEAQGPPRPHMSQERSVWDRPPPAQERRGITNRPLKAVLGRPVTRENWVFSLVVGVMSSHCQLSCVLPYDAEAKMGDGRSLYHADFLQFNVLSANILEQSDTFAEQYGHKVKMHFVQQSSF